LETGCCLSTNPKGDIVMAGEPRFLCDGMLGSLARWLRFLGYDTLYPEILDDSEILQMAQKEGRILLTRDRELAQRAGAGGILIASVALDEQILQLHHAIGLDLDGERRMLRCPKCNTPLEGVSKEAVREIACERQGVPGAGQIPPRVLERQKYFWRCPGCGQIYWRGSHYDRIIGKIGELDKGYRVQGTGYRVRRRPAGRRGPEDLRSSLSNRAALDCDEEDLERFERSSGDDG